MGRTPITSNFTGRTPPNASPSFLIQELLGKLTLENGQGAILLENSVKPWKGRTPVANSWI